MLTVSYDSYAFQLKRLTHILTNYHAQTWRNFDEIDHVYATLTQTINLWRTQSKVKRCIEIHYDKDLELPLVWFNFYSIDGKRLSIDEITEIGVIPSALIPHLKEPVNFEVISKNNPEKNEQYYCFVPTKTCENQEGKEFSLVNWLYFFSQFVGINIDVEMVTEFVDSWYDGI
uniref:Autophagy_act_C domain-containing protein n=1 Tax=Strongyloides venezuelensis TaxID=75913 RepID=A0A0K0FNP4_STRVS